MNDTIVPLSIYRDYTEGFPVRWKQINTTFVIDVVEGFLVKIYMTFIESGAYKESLK